MSAGMMFLTILAILVFCGLLQRVLDRMYLSDRQALGIIGAMILGTLLPNISIGRVSISIGGAVIPLLLCIWLLFKVDTAKERWKAMIGSILTGGGILALSTFLPAEAEALFVDPMWIYGIVGGLIAWVLGRSRRAAFICGVAGILLADSASAMLIWIQGYKTQLVLGGAGIADASVISGVIGVLFCEIVGEIAERFVRVRQARTGGRV